MLYYKVLSRVCVDLYMRKPIVLVERITKLTHNYQYISSIFGLKGKKEMTKKYPMIAKEI